MQNRINIKFSRSIIVCTILLSLIYSNFSFGGTWQSNSNGRYYQNDNGTYVRNQWKLIDGKWYYFSDQGYVLTNQWIEGKYFVGKDGAMLANTQTTDGYYVDENGRYIEESWGWINGRYIYDGELKTWDGIGQIKSEHIPGYRNRGQIEVRRISDNLIVISYIEGSYAGKTVDYVKQSYNSRYIFEMDMEELSFENGRIVIWPQEGDAEVDYYVTYYKKIS